MRALSERCVVCMVAFDGQKECAGGTFELVPDGLWDDVEVAALDEAGAQTELVAIEERGVVDGTRRTPEQLPRYPAPPLPVPVIVEMRTSRRAALRAQGTVVRVQCRAQRARCGYEPLAVNDAPHSAWLHPCLRLEVVYGALLGRCRWQRRSRHRCTPRCALAGAARVTGVTVSSRRVAEVLS